MKQVPCWAPINTRRHLKKFRRQGDQAPGIGIPLLYPNPHAFLL